ncbi:CinA family protein [Actinopolyspora mortivallis]|uniref:CinA family protein n=1 Tax=Actinopolyspora mortivallis TaxID=33906 RepID=UPI000372501B|nr:CinA family protein [Actinopolyspora mortivallis]
MGPEWLTEQHRRVAEILALLRTSGRTVATAESLTGGLVGVLLTEVSGASAVVRGGLVVYSTALKHELAGVDAELLATRGAVDPLVAEQLAEGARTRCGADWGIGLTGVAGPEPQDGREPGTVFLGFSGPEGRWVRTARLSGGRHEVREAAAAAALEHFGTLLR